LREIRNYIAEDNVPAARNFLAKLTQAFGSIAEMPSKGHTREDLTDLPVRFWPVGSYLIVYDPGKRPVEILRVLHGARDVETILERQ
jgi:antitoxin ParD1/3/4/toxin ParE1/3/4